MTGSGGARDCCARTVKVGSNCGGDGGDARVDYGNAIYGRHGRYNLTPTVGRWRVRAWDERRTSGNRRIGVVGWRHLAL